MKSINLKRIIKKVDDLPTLPRTILKITELVNNPKSSARDLAKVITKDQVLTARLLKLVNSSFYGFPQKISTVTGAIVLLGFDAIRNLLLTSSVYALFLENNKKEKFRLEEFWDHSLGCAVGAKVIGNYLRNDKVEELFVSGLLHDIGKIVQVLYFPDDFIKVASMVEEENVLMITAENQLLDYTHAEIGKLLAEKWNLPLKLTCAISCHHHPEIESRFFQEVAVIHLADILCRAINLGSGGDKKIPPLHRDAWEILGLKISALEPIVEEMEREFADISMSVTNPS